MKRLVLGLFQITLAISLFATPIDLEFAKTIAKNAYYQKVNQYHQEMTFDDIRITEHFVIAKNGEEMLYIFNFDGLGYIIISADDAMTPVIAYSFEGEHDPANQPDNFKGWLDGRAGAVKYVRDNNITATAEIKSKWIELADISNLSLKAGGKSVEPLLTCTWNQDWPYNYYCPADPAGPNGHVYVGCVATAMSQIMFYWRFPHQGSGSHSYNCPGYGTQTANFGATTYYWDGMVDNSDTKVNLPMALIGYHAAVSVDMEFSPDGSGASTLDVDDALKNYFNYDDSVQVLSKTNYQWSAWRLIIEDELDLSRPLYFSGRDGANQYTSAGHAFVLDGYHADGTYHFNFGWSGSDNGWYNIEDPVGYEWHYWQQMVRKIFPDDASYPYGCTGGAQQTSLVGSFEDGSGPIENYEGTASCNWLITPQTPQDSVSKITLNFVALDTESEDIVTIYDGDTPSAPVLGTYSGSVPPTGFINSTGNKMLISFTADGDGTTGTGYRVEYSTTQPSWCSGLTQFTEPTGSFTDGSGDWYYKNQSNCMWKVQPAWAADLTISFTEFNTEADADIVKIYDASNNQLLATYSGEYTSGNMPDPITIPSGKLFMTFQSDGAVNKPGWTAEWEIGNVGTKEENAGFDHLSVYPNPAQNLLNVSFRLDENQAFEIRMISATGKVVYSQTTDDFTGYYVNTIDVSDMAKGVYFLNLTNENGSVNKKVVIK